ncbi:MAG: 2'-5' RNA ligase family protein [Thermoplasmata archaeon]
MAQGNQPRPLHGVGSLLDLPSTSRVKFLWSRLEQEFGLRGALVMPYPHISYQVAQDYDRPSLETALEELARDTPPISIRTTGLGSFDGNWPVLFVAVQKDEALRELHQRVWETCLPHARDVFSYYHPDPWVPHITLVHGEERGSLPLSAELVQRALGSLNSGVYRWEISIDNIALVWDYGTTHKPARTFLLQGRG